MKTVGFIGTGGMGSGMAANLIKAGDIFRLDTPGGGGHGDPLARAAERVLVDVRDGNVSPEAAERDYGVVVRREGSSFTIDQIATDAKRAALKTHTQ